MWLHYTEMLFAALNSASSGAIVSVYCLFKETLDIFQE